MALILFCNRQFLSDIKHYLMHRHMEPLLKYPQIHFLGPRFFIRVPSRKFLFKDDIFLIFHTGE